MKNIPYLVVLIILLAFLPSKSEDFSEEFNLILSLIYFCSLIYFFWWQSKVTKNWLRVDVVFLIGFTIVHIQIPFFASVGVEPHNPDLVWINKNVVNYATWMSVVAALCWMLGFSIFSKKTNPATLRSRETFKVNTLLYDLIMLFVFIFFLITVGGEFLKGVYDRNSWGVGAGYFYLILGVMLYLRIVYFFRNVPFGTSVIYILRKFLFEKIFLITLSLYCILFAATGSRSELLYIIFVLAAAYSIFVKPFKLRHILVYTLIGAFVFTLMSSGRSRNVEDVADGNILTRGLEMYVDSGGERGLTSELASSVRIQYRAIDLVPEKHPYLYGITFISGITSAIPFMTKAYVELFSIPHYYTGSANFFTYIGQGENPTWGEGSEILADIYVNFGFFMVFALFFLFGCFVALVSNNARKLRFNYILIYTSLMMTSIFINRAELLLPLQGIVYILLLHFIFSRKI